MFNVVEKNYASIITILAAQLQSTDVYFIRANAFWQRVRLFPHSVIANINPMCALAEVFIHTQSSSLDFNIHSHRLWSYDLTAR